MKPQEITVKRITKNGKCEHVYKEKGLDEYHISAGDVDIYLSELLEDTWYKFMLFLEVMTGEEAPGYYHAELMGEA